MSNALLEYFNKRMGENQTPVSRMKMPGPLITISREVGCNGVQLAQAIADHLNLQQQVSNWRVLSKEVFYESASHLDMEPERVKRIFRIDSYALNDILTAFGSKKYKSEKVIIKTVNEVIHSFADEGYCIIVGRAAHIIAHDIRNALHLRLAAPLDYRISSIMKKKNMAKPEAIEFIKKVERERAAFRKAIRKESLEVECFDLCINRASFSDRDIIELIDLAAEKKKIFNDYVRAEY